MSPVTHRLNPKALMRIAIVMAFIQFTNALEYMAFTPVFAFMAKTFAVPVSFSGYASGSYTLGAVISGMMAFYWIDRFNKKQFLLKSMTLLAILTFLSTLATNFNMLLLLRFCAGWVGGTTMGVGIAILINHSPANLRGKMLATVIASFSLVSIAGMPAILFLCTHYDWQIALWALSSLCLLSLPLIIFILPADTLGSSVKTRLPIDRQTLLFASCNALVQFSPMLIIPILTPLMMQYLGVQPAQLPVLFLIGGVAGYVATKITGILTLHLSALMLACLSTLLFLTSLLIPALGYHYAALFISVFLGASYSRLVSASSVALQYPEDKHRASFTSLQTAMMFLLTTCAFFLSSLLLPEQAIARQNLNRLLLICGLTAACFPLMIIILQKKLAKLKH